ncbi:MAG TPA: DsrE family protein [Candidatus Omnitrophota bacterium]|nr:DsrE family protein [Candidatus Omnitrophota bacterium]
MRILTAAALLAPLLLSPPVLAESYYGKQKVVYHVNTAGGEADKAYLMTLTNVQNHINAVGKDNVEVKIVMHGDGVGLVKDAKSNMDVQAKVMNLKDQKVAFLVCENTLKGRKIDADRDLFDVDKGDIVPSGVAELSRLQQQGYTYIRP